MPEAVRQAEAILVERARGIGDGELLKIVRALKKRTDVGPDGGGDAHRRILEFPAVDAVLEPLHLLPVEAPVLAAALGVVGVEKDGLGLPMEHRGQPPGETHRIVEPCVHALAASRERQVPGVADKEHAVLAIVRRDAVLEAAVRQPDGIRQRQGLVLVTSRAIACISSSVGSRSGSPVSSDRKNSRW